MANTTIPKRVFISHLDSNAASACARVFKAHGYEIYGTLANDDYTNFPPPSYVTQITPNPTEAPDEFRRQLLSCSVVIYDLTNPKEAVDAATICSTSPNKRVFLCISTFLAWSRTELQPSDELIENDGVDIDSLPNELEMELDDVKALYDEAKVPYPDRLKRRIARQEEKEARERAAEAEAEAAEEGEDENEEEIGDNNADSGPEVDVNDAVEENSDKNEENEGSENGEKEKEEEEEEEEEEEPEPDEDEEDEENNKITEEGIKEEDWENRRPHPLFRDHLAAERAVASILRFSENLVGAIVVPGLIYGCGENSYGLFHIFKGIWSGRLQQIPFFNEQLGFKSKVKIPTIHALDLALLLHGLVTVQPEKDQPYVFAVEPQSVQTADLIMQVGAQLLTNDPVAERRRLEYEKLQANMLPKVMTLQTYKEFLTKKKEYENGPLPSYVRVAKKHEYLLDTVSYGKGLERPDAISDEHLQIPALTANAPMVLGFARDVMQATTMTTLVNKYGYVKKASLAVKAAKKIVKDELGGLRVVEKEVSWPYFASDGGILTNIEIAFSEFLHTYNIKPLRLMIQGARPRDTKDMAFISNFVKSVMGLQPRVTYLPLNSDKNDKNTGLLDFNYEKARDIACQIALKMSEDFNSTIKLSADEQQHRNGKIMNDKDLIDDNKNKNNDFSITMRSVCIIDGSAFSAISPESLQQLYKQLTFSLDARYCGWILVNLPPDLRNPFTFFEKAAILDLYAEYGQYGLKRPRKPKGSKDSSDDNNENEQQDIDNANDNVDNAENGEEEKELSVYEFDENGEEVNENDEDEDKWDADAEIGDLELDDSEKTKLINERLLVPCTVPAHYVFNAVSSIAVMRELNKKPLSKFDSCDANVCVNHPSYCLRVPKPDYIIDLLTETDKDTYVPPEIICAEMVEKIGNEAREKIEEQRKLAEAQELAALAKKKNSKKKKSQSSTEDADASQEKKPSAAAEAYKIAMRNEEKEAKARIGVITEPVLANPDNKYGLIFEKDRYSSMLQIYADQLLQETDRRNSEKNITAMNFGINTAIETYKKTEFLRLKMVRKMFIKRVVKNLKKRIIYDQSRKRLEKAVLEELKEKSPELFEKPGEDEEDKEEDINEEADQNEDEEEEFDPENFFVGKYYNLEGLTEREIRKFKLAAPVSKESEDEPDEEAEAEANNQDQDEDPNIRSERALRIKKIKEEKIRKLNEKLQGMEKPFVNTPFVPASENDVALLPEPHPHGFAWLLSMDLTGKLLNEVFNTNLQKKKTSDDDNDDQPDEDELIALKRTRAEVDAHIYKPVNCLVLKHILSKKSEETKKRIGYADTAMEVLKFIGPPRFFVPTLRERLKEKELEEQKRKLEKMKQEEERLRQAEIAHTKELNRQAEIKHLKEKFTKDEEERVRKLAIPLRKYLNETVLEHVLDGLCETAKIRPSEPIKFLGEFLMNRAIRPVRTDSDALEVASGRNLSTSNDDFLVL